MNSFDADYNFADKFLPAWKIVYKGNNNDRYYVETSTGRLSKHTNDRDLNNYENYSFAFLHKHEFLSSFGKKVKDISTMFWAFAQIVVWVSGRSCILFGENKADILKTRSLNYRKATSKY